MYVSFAFSSHYSNCAAWKFIWQLNWSKIIIFVSGIFLSCNWWSTLMNTNKWDLCMVPTTNSNRSIQKQDRCVRKVFCWTHIKQPNGNVSNGIVIVNVTITMVSLYIAIHRMAWMVMVIILSVLHILYSIYLYTMYCVSYCMRLFLYWWCCVCFPTSKMMFDVRQWFCCSVFVSCVWNI